MALWLAFWTLAVLGSSYFILFKEIGGDAAWNGLPRFGVLEMLVLVVCVSPTTWLLSEELRGGEHETLHAIWAYGLVMVGHIVGWLFGASYVHAPSQGDRTANIKGLLSLGVHSIVGACLALMSAVPLFWLVLLFVGVMRTMVMKEERESR